MKILANHFYTEYYIKVITLVTFYFRSGIECHHTVYTLGAILKQKKKNRVCFNFNNAAFPWGNHYSDPPHRAQGSVEQWLLGATLSWATHPSGLRNVQHPINGDLQPFTHGNRFGWPFRQKEKGVVKGQPEQWKSYGQEEFVSNNKQSPNRA